MVKSENIASSVIGIVMSLAIAIFGLNWLTGFAEGMSFGGLDVGELLGLVAVVVMLGIVAAYVTDFI